MRFSLIVIGIFVALVGFIATRPSKSVDDFEYNNPPPMFVFKYVIPLLDRVRRALGELNPPIFQIFDELGLVQAAHLIHSLVRLNVPDLLLQGPMSVEQLAKKTRCDVDMLYRALRRLSLNGYFRELPPAPQDAVVGAKNLYRHRFENTPKTHALSSANVVNARAMLLHQMQDITPLYGHFERVLQSRDVNLFKQVHGVQNMWDYFVGDVGSNFNRAMEDLDGVGGTIAALDFPWNDHCDIVLDIGGGKGRYLAAILQHNPNITRGVLFDLPFAIQEARQAWSQRYSPLLNQRVQFVGGDFFVRDQIPVSNGGSNGGNGRHCYVLRVVIHDWSDEDAVKILSNIESRMREGDSVIVSEVIPDEYTTIPAVGWMDVVMATFQGKERTVEQMNDLLTKAGLKPISKVGMTRSLFRLAVSTK